MLGVYASGVGRSRSATVLVIETYGKAGQWRTYQPSGDFCQLVSVYTSSPRVEILRSNSVYRKHPWRKFPIYAIAQVLGAFCASGVVYGTLKP